MAIVTRPSIAVQLSVNRVCRREALRGRSSGIVRRQLLFPVVLIVADQQLPKRSCMLAAALPDREQMNLLPDALERAMKVNVQSGHSF